MCQCEKHKAIRRVTAEFVRHKRRVLPGHVYRYLFQMYGVGERTGEKYLRELVNLKVLDTDPPFIVYNEQDQGVLA